MWGCVSNFKDLSPYERIKVLSSSIFILLLFLSLWFHVYWSQCMVWGIGSTSSFFPTGCRIFPKPVLNSSWRNSNSLPPHGFSFFNGLRQSLPFGLWKQQHQASSNQANHSWKPNRRKSHSQLKHAGSIIRAPLISLKKKTPNQKPKKNLLFFFGDFLYWQIPLPSLTALFSIINISPIPNSAGLQFLIGTWNT